MKSPNKIKNLIEDCKELREDIENCNNFFPEIQGLSGEEEELAYKSIIKKGGEEVIH